MKKVLYMMTLLLICSCKQSEVKNVIIPSKIDSLVSQEAVQNFVRTTDSLLLNFVLKSIHEYKRDSLDVFANKLADSLNIRDSFYKADLDNNGLTDLLILGQAYKCEDSTASCYFDPFIIMNFGNKYNVIDILRDYHSSIAVPKIIEENDRLFLEINTPYVDWDNTRRIKNNQVKLVYKFDDLIEFNENPANYTVEKIEYSTSPCYGYCPIFKININENGLSTFYAEAYNFSANYERNSEKYFGKDEGKFTAVINKKKYDELTEILNYIDFENLQEDYSISWTDNPGCTLKITYDGGRTKTINDYGMVGTYGLKRLYKVIADLRFNQKWK